MFNGSEEALSVRSLCSSLPLRNIALCSNKYLQILGKVVTFMCWFVTAIGSKQTPVPFVTHRLLYLKYNKLTLSIENYYFLSLSDFSLGSFFKFLKD